MQSLTQQTLKIYWQNAKKYKWHIFGIISFLTLSVSAETVGPFLYKQFINLLSTYDLTQYHQLIIILLLIMAARATRSYAFRIKDWLNDYFEPRVMADLNNICFEYLHKNSYNFFSGNFVGSLVNKVKKYERSFETITDRLIDDFLRTFLAIAFAVGVLAYSHLVLGLALLIWCIIYLGIIYFFSLYKLKFDLKKPR